MIARILNLAGLYLGEAADLVSPASDNTPGSWENRRFVALNDQLLNAIGGGWDFPVPFPTRWSNNPRLKSLEDAAARVLGAVAEQTPFGWKDPRNSLTLPFWQKIAGRLKIVLCVRHPLEVAFSLNVRHRSSPAFNLNLWKTYNERVLAATTRADRLITCYGAYFDNAPAEVERLLRFAGLEVTAASLDAGATAIAGRLRHHRLTTQHLAAAHLDPALVDLYERLLVEAGQAPDRAVIGARKPTAHGRRLPRTGIERSQPTRPLDAPAMDVLRESSDLRSALAAQDAAIAVKKATILVRDVTINELLNDVTAMSQELDGARHNVERLEARSLELDAARRRLEQRLQAQSLELDETRRRLGRFEASAMREYEQLKRRLRDVLDRAIPDHATVRIVSGGDDAFLDLNGRRAGHFPQTTDGVWNGHPATSREAIDQLETIGAGGGAYLVFPAPALWWLDHYDDLRTYLYERCRLVVEREGTAIVFELPALTPQHDPTQP